MPSSRSLSTVMIRAMSCRTLAIWLAFSSCPTACLKRSSYSSRREVFRRVPSSSSSRTLSSSTFIANLRPTRRSTKRVLIGSLDAASFIASLATCCVTPPISKSTRPGLTTATQPSGLPLPEPMRVSAGFLVIDLSGKTRIQIWPPRFT